MSVIPVLFDARPAYLGAGDAPASLLLLPTGLGTMLREIAERVGAVCAHAPYVLPTFEPGPGYAEAVRREEPAVLGVLGPEALRDPLARFDATDTLLLVSPECYPLDGLDLRALVGGRGGRAAPARGAWRRRGPGDERRPSRRAPAGAAPSGDADGPGAGGGGPTLRHLLAFEDAPAATRELAQAGADGRLRRVQRYFGSSTRLQPAGVVASLVPVAHALAGADARCGALAELRASLCALGVPSEDVTYAGRLVNLRDEAGALALVERRVLGLAGAPDGAAEGPLFLSHGARVDPSARFVGRVVVAAGACVEASALVVGPAYLGRGAHVARSATVAQCVVLGGARVPADACVRHRVVGAEAPGAGPPAAPAAQRRHAPGPAGAAGDAPADGSAGAPAARRAPRYDAVKRVVEPVVALVALVALAPLFALCAALIVVDSGLPVFYGDRREGRRGRPFRCWKFRSMRPDADLLQRALAAAQELDGPQFKMARDPRVTRVGGWLRRLNVDELPQLWNVACGEMSFVGPRPSPARENQICVPWRFGRLSVRPGITGLWQVCRHDRAAGDFHQWIHYDLLYVRHASFAVDARILLATLLTLNGRRPAQAGRILRRARPTAPAAAAPVPAAMGAADAAADAAAGPTRPGRPRGHWAPRPRPRGWG